MSVIWPLARVTKLILEADGVARVAKLKTAVRATTRRDARLCLLPKKDVKGRQAARHIC